MISLTLILDHFGSHIEEMSRSFDENETCKKGFYGNTNRTVVFGIIILIIIITF